MEQLNNKNIKVIVLYPSALCNLCCKYCYIDKNPVLKQIDDALEDSFNSDYYFEFSKKIFDKNIVDEMQFWGGEPFLGFHRLYNLLPKFIEYYPKLSHFLTSTNFTVDNFEDEFFGFLNILGKYPERTFQFSLQLSIDGPEYINDNNRGIGVTKSFLEHYNSLVNKIDDILPKNVILDVHFKQTLTEKEIAELTNQELFINYFKFFDELVTLFKKKVKNPNVSIGCNLPNTAVPGETTVADGQRFAKYTKLAYELTKMNY